MKVKDIERIPINYELLRLITPQDIKVEFSRIKMGDNISRVFFINGFPSKVNLGWLANLKDIPNTSVSLVVTPIEDVQGYINGISKGMTTDKNTYNTSQNEALRTQAKFKLESAEKIIEDITVNNIPYIKLGIYLRTIADTENDFSEQVRSVKNKVAGMGLKARIPGALQEKAIKQASPFDTYYTEILERSNKDMSLQALFGGLPFSGSGLIDEKGYYIGTDEDGRMIAVDMFEKKNDRTNSNILIEGSSGSGKSFLAKKIMLNEWLNGCKIFIIDPESEYRPLCKLVEGKWIDASGGRGENVGRINPLQINLVDSQGEFEEDSEEYNVTKSALALHLDFLSTFFKLYYPEISSLSTSLLMEILEELYKNFGIDYETDISKIKINEFPIMEDLYKLLEKKAESKDIKHQKEIEELRSIIRRLAIGDNSEIFNRIYYN